MKTASVRPQPTFSSLEQRVANQERRINEGVRNGSLTETEASSLRQRVEAAKVGIEADKFDGNGLTQRKAAEQLLNGISKDIQTAKGNDEMDVGKGVSDIEQRIAAGTKDGTLTEAEGAKLSEQLTALKGKLEAATTPEAKKAVQDEMKALSKDVHSARHDEQFNAGKRLENFEQRIEAGLKDGTLKPAEAARLKGEVAALQLLKDVGFKSGKLFNRVSHDIFHQRHDAQVDVPKRTAAMTSQLDSAVKSGKLTAAQAETFKAELAKLSGEGVEAAGPRLNILQQQIVSAIMAAKPQPVPQTAV
jgi:polyhydroxyalkanoate synthesis regulator phasin